MKGQKYEEFNMNLSNPAQLDDHRDKEPAQQSGTRTDQTRMTHYLSSSPIPHGTNHRHQTRVSAESLAPHTRIGHSLSTIETEPATTLIPRTQKPPPRGLTNKRNIVIF